MVKKYKDIWFDDFTIGRVFLTESSCITGEEIIAFGKKYAPLPYHTDPNKAKEYMFGELVAAGFHTCSVSFGLFIESGILDACAMGSPGFNKLRWRKPVLPGDRLQVKSTVTNVSPARDDNGRNLVTMLFETFNQDKELVLEMETKHYVRDRPSSYG